jgi:protein-S-isoprenylcysteine O-methyltransferase Ste14
MSSLSPSTLARSALSRVALALVVFMAAFFLSAGTWNYWEAWVYIALMFGMMLTFGVYLFAKAPDLLERRMRFREPEAAQRRIISWSWIPFVLMFIVPGFDHRWNGSDIPAWAVLVADGLVVVTYILLIWVFLTNHYAARVVQVEAGQQVITTGPYAIVRHPMYAIILLMYVSTPIALGSYWALLPTLALPFILVARLRNEEEVLRRDLPGYIEYTHKVRYRLIPGVW